MTVNEKTAWNVLSANAKKATTKTKKKVHKEQNRVKTSLDLFSTRLIQVRLC